MRFKEIKPLLKEDRDLLEINMSPSNLEKLAFQIDSRAGMEFEMIVPDVKNNVDDVDDDEYPTPRRADTDRRTRSIEDIINFFQGDYNSRQAINRLRDSLETDFLEWQWEQIAENWGEEGRELLREYIENNNFDRDSKMDEAYDQLGLTDDQKEAANQAGASISKLSDARGNEDWQNWKKASNMVKEKLDDLVEESWNSKDSNYDNAYEEYSTDQAGDFSDRDWLDAVGYGTMEDIMRNYTIDWSAYDETGSLAIGDIESVAAKFGPMIGRPVNWSLKYHGAKREPGKYAVEPDGSLQPDNSSDAGIEFVSPPLALDDMLGDLYKVKAWADKTGCYTNESTGLHINVSVPGLKGFAENLDYIKLALLLGDQYVLEQFGRVGNTYANSAMSMIKTRIAQNPENAAALLGQMKEGLGQLASKVVHDGITNKFTSINTKKGYIEFRSPGGDWLGDEFFNKIKPTLLRFVVALDAAMDPMKYRDEYLKKLYTVLKPKGQDDTLSYFARFAAGELPKSALKSFVRQAQLERASKREKAAAPPSQRQRAEQLPVPSSGDTWTGQWLVLDSRDNLLHIFGGIGNSQADANRVAADWLSSQGFSSGLASHGVQVVPEMR